MHKSVGNVVYLRDLTDHGWDSKTIRLFFFSARYRDTVDLSEASLEQARSQRQRLQDFVERLRSVDADVKSGNDLSQELLATFETAMDNDLNTPEALASIFAIVKRGNALMDAGGLGKGSAAALISALKKVDSVLGVITFEVEGLPPDLSALVEQREAARRRRDFVESDRLRGLLEEKGIAVEDTPSGTRWKRVTRGG